MEMSDLLHSDMSSNGSHMMKENTCGALQRHACLCCHRDFPFGFQVLITTAIYFIYKVGCMFVNAGAMMKINVLLCCA